MKSTTIRNEADKLYNATAKATYEQVSRELADAEARVVTLTAEKAKLAAVLAEYEKTDYDAVLRPVDVKELG